MTTSTKVRASRSDRLRSVGWPYLLLLPAIAVTVLSTYGPIAGNLGISFTGASLRIPGSESRFVGLDNYEDLLTSGRTWQILVQTIIYAVGATAIAAVLAVATALLFRRRRGAKKLRYRTALFALILLPWITPPVVVAFIWKYLYAPFGPLNGALTDLGLVGSPVQFLTDITNAIGPLSLAFVSVLQVGVWSSFPFLFVFANAAMSSIPDDLYEAAELEGAAGWTSVRFITLPLIAPVLEAAVFLVIVIRFGTADLPLLLTGGGPLDATNVLGVYLYNTAFQQLRLGEASAIGMLLLLAALPFAVMYIRRSDRQLRSW